MYTHSIRHLIRHLKKWIVQICKWKRSSEIKKIHIIFCLLALLLSGCAHGLIGDLPEIENEDESSELILIRSCNLMVEAGVIFYVSFDGSEVVGLKNCKYTRFIVPSGEHILNVGLQGNPSFAGIHINLTSGRKYYYFLDSQLNGKPISALNAKQVYERINPCEYLQIDNKLDEISVK
jgi:hypothetical protein